MMDSAWVSVINGLVGTVIGAAVSGAICFGALKAWMARREEREKSSERRLTNAEADIEVQSLGLQKLDVRVSVLEERTPHRQPLDYAR